LKVERAQILLYKIALGRLKIINQRQTQHEYAMICLRDLHLKAESLIKKNLIRMDLNIKQKKKKVIIKGNNVNTNKNLEW
jgi:hypothetical protein